MTQKEIQKHGVKSTTPGFPELELALIKAKKKLGWKDLTAFVVKWCDENQPDSLYSLKYWKPK